jgi:competence protein ComEC
MAYVDRELRWPTSNGPGVSLRVAGTLRRPRLRRGADFDWPAYLRRRGIALELRLHSLRGTGGRRGAALGAIDAARSRAERRLAAGMSRAHADLARGMVLGQDEGVAEVVREDFRRSGLAHILTNCQ